MNNVMRKRYSNDFRDQAVALVGMGKPVPEVAQELGIGTSVLYRWTEHLRQAGQFGGAATSVTPGRDGGGEADELRRLRKENAHLLMENDILKKAAVILGTQPPARPAR